MNDTLLDFYKWCQKRYGDDVDEDKVYEFYIRYHTCNCESCQFRRQRGIMLVKLHEECKIPTAQEVEDAFSRTTI